MTNRDRGQDHCRPSTVGIGLKQHPYRDGRDGKVNQGIGSHNPRKSGNHVGNGYNDGRAMMELMEKGIDTEEDAKEKEPSSIGLFTIKE